MEREWMLFSIYEWSQTSPGFTFSIILIPFQYILSLVEDIHNAETYSLDKNYIQLAYMDQDNRCKAKPLGIDE